MRKQNPAILRYLDSVGIHIEREVPKTQPRPEQPVRITASLNTARKGSDYRRDYRTIKSGAYYILEIVRPDTKESRDLYALDGTRNINGAPRIVSKQRMYVEKVISSGTTLDLYCVGVDNFGRRADGVYTFYQTPDPTNHRKTFVLSITKC